MKKLKIPKEYQKIIDELVEEKIIFYEGNLDPDAVESLYYSGYDPETLDLVLEYHKDNLYIIAYPKVYPDFNVQIHYIIFRKGLVTADRFDKELEDITDWFNLDNIDELKAYIIENNL